MKISDMTTSQIVRTIWKERMEAGEDELRIEVGRYKQNPQTVMKFIRDNDLNVIKHAGLWIVSKK